MTHVKIRVSGIRKALEEQEHNAATFAEMCTGSMKSKIKSIFSTKNEQASRGMRTQRHDWPLYGKVVLSGESVRRTEQAEVCHRHF